MKPSGSAYRPDIDGLRAVAILAVVAYHAFPSLFPGGFVGVDVFFVISGFLISSIILKALTRGDFSFRDFYAHRVRRIFPSLIVVLAAAFALGWILLMPDELQQLGKHIAASAGFSQNLALWKEAGYFDKASELKPLMHLWSLGIEEQYYLLYPLFLWTAWRAGLGAFWPLAALGAGSFAFDAVRLRSDAVGAFFLPQARVWELLCGGMLAHLTLSRGSSRRGGRDVAAVVGLAFILAASMLLDRSQPFPGWRALAPVAGAWLLIDAGASSWINRELLASRAMVFIGLISYPLYLWHWPLLSIARITASGEPPAALRGGLVAISFGLAWLTYLFVERPIRFGPNKARKTALLCCLTLAVGCGGYAVFRHEGFVSRFPEEIRAIPAYKFDMLSSARYPRCWLDNDQDFDEYSPNCAGGIGDRTDGRTILVWGDSHAARLYPGLAEVFAGRAAVAQYTLSSCPPIMEVGTPNCIRNNRHVMSIVKKYKPATVILYAVWNVYAPRWNDESQAHSKGLLDTVAGLKRLGVKNILILGPYPLWKKELPRLVYETWKRDPLHARPASRMKEGLNPAAAVIDEDLRRLLAGRPADYFSVRDAFCGPDGCLVRTTDELTSFVTPDQGHLTDLGARYLAQRLPSFVGR